jgi:hypothetical protein
MFSWFFGAEETEKRFVVLEKKRSDSNAALK